MENEDLRDLVRRGDLLAAARAIHGRHVTLTSFNAQRATASIQGFTSLMLRVHATLDLHGETLQEKFIVKRLPTLEVHRNMIQQMGVFESEIIYFTKVAPYLRGPVPLVRCYIAHEDTLIMEDLCASGYQTLYSTMREVSTMELPLSYVRLVARKMAQLHAASVGMTWAPEVEETMGRDKMVNEGIETLFNNVSITVTAVLKKLYPDEAKHGKFVNWVGGKNLMNIMAQLAQPVENGVNVICQGDCWVNNVMFKLDPETKKPLDLKFIDLQLIRKTHPSRDLLYFLYTSTSREFRIKHEKEIMQTYVAAFNTFVGRTPDLLTLADFESEYEKARMYGQAIALFLRPTSVIENLFPEPDEELTAEKFDPNLQPSVEETTLLQFEKNPTYKQVVTEVVEELMVNLEAAGLV